MRKENVTLRAFRRYHSYNPKYFPFKLLQTVFENLSPYFTLWMSSSIVTALYESKPADEVYTLILMTLLGILLMRIASAVLKRSAEIQLKVLENNEAAAFNAKTLSLDYDKLENPKIRQHRRNILENSWINGYGTNQMQWIIEKQMSALANIALSLLLFAEMLSYLLAAGLSLWSLLLLAAMCLFFVLNFFLSRRRARTISEGSKKIGDFMLEENRLSRGHNPHGMDSRIYRQQPLLKQVMLPFVQKHLTLFQEAQNGIFQSSIPVLVCERLIELCSYLIICLYCAMGVFPVGSLIKYVGYLSKLSTNINEILYLTQNAKANEPFLADYLAYFDIPNDMYQGSLSVEKRSDKKFDIEFRNVSFRYAGAAEDAVKNISVRLKVGEKLAVVGMNGSGKTTFIKLLCRLYDPTEGEILMNDFNIRKYDYRQYLDLFSVVFQDYKLLSVPLGNNVASAQHWDTQKAEQLLEKVGFGARYAEMPRGLETPLYKDFDEDGVNVSGGEAQKIALARALYKDAPFIILDEPTAALDPIAEAEIYAKFDEIVGGKTAIYISHRLSSCRFCDRIVVFDQGEIVQIGTHEELLADASGKYYELWNAQAQYYAKE